MSNGITESDETRLIKIGIICITVFLVFAFGGFASCTVLTSLDDVAKIAEQNKEQLMRIEAVKELIDQGTDPIAARCSVYGWDDGAASSSALICSNLTDIKPPAVIPRSNTN